MMSNCDQAGNVREEAGPRPLPSRLVHDLRVQIGVVMGYSQLILDEAGRSLNPEHREFVSLILSASRSLKRLIDEHLDTSVPPRDPSPRPTAVQDEATAQPGAGGPCITVPAPGGSGAREEPQA